MKKKKKWVLLILAITSLGFPLQSAAQHAETPVGIGFSQEVKMPISPSNETNNVIPRTSGFASNDSGKSLPKTGDSTNQRLQTKGIACMFISFWLFLFLRLKKEGEYE